MHIFAQLPVSPEQVTTMTAGIQWGFAWFAGIVFISLTSIIVWLIRQLLAVLKENNHIVAGNTEAIGKVHETADEQKRLLGDIRDQLLSRPCMLKENNAKG